MKVNKLLTLITSTLILQLVCAFAGQAGQDPISLAKFKNELKKDRFDVTTGEVKDFDAVKLYCSGEINSAMYYSNEPYLQVWVPTSANSDQQSIDFQLDPDEAVVLIGLTPPPAKYFSYGPYLAWSKFPDGRKHIFATLGDAVNNATVKTIGSAPFNAPVAVIFTPDQGTDARVRAALRRAGYPSAIINTVVLPASMLKLGHNNTADTLQIVLRNAIWQKQTDGDFYINNPPLSAFRVTPQTPANANPFPAPPLRIRGTGQTEMSLMNKLGQLRQRIVEQYKDLYSADIISRPMCYEGYDAIQRELEMCGDCRDAFYLGAGYFKGYHLDPGSVDLTLANDEFLILYGVNHVATGKAAYMNTNIYADKDAQLTVGAVDDRMFPGSARLYFEDPAADMMYAYKASRNCGKQANCLPLSVPKGCTRLTLDENTLLGIFTRIYLEPGTKIGPAMPEILYDRVIKFSPRKP